MIELSKLVATAESFSKRWYEKVHEEKNGILVGNFNPAIFDEQAFSIIYQALALNIVQLNPYPEMMASILGCTGKHDHGHSPIPHRLVVATKSNKELGEKKAQEFASAARANANIPDSVLRIPFVVFVEPEGLSSDSLVEGGPLEKMTEALTKRFGLLYS